MARALGLVVVLAVAAAAGGPPGKADTGTGATTPPALVARAEQDTTGSPVPQAAAEEQRGPVTGFPLPRYVSMRASEGNARRGPSRSHRIDWVFTRRDMLALHARPDAASPVRARAELGVIGRLRECRPDWCLLEADGFRGWVDPAALWGVDPGESFD
jgi:SH3-like domain-containing protein